LQEEVFTLLLQRLGPVAAITKLSSE